MADINGTPTAGTLIRLAYPLTGKLPFRITGTSTHGLPAGLTAYVLAGDLIIEGTPLAQENWAGYINVEDDDQPTPRPEHISVQLNIQPAAAPVPAQPNNTPAQTTNVAANQGANMPQNPLPVGNGVHNFVAGQANAVNLVQFGHSLALGQAPVYGAPQNAAPTPAPQTTSVVNTGGNNTAIVVLALFTFLLGAVGIWALSKASHGQGVNAVQQIAIDENGDDTDNLRDDMNEADREIRATADADRTHNDEQRNWIIEQVSKAFLAERGLWQAGDDDTFDLAMAELTVVERIALDAQIDAQIARSRPTVINLPAPEAPPAANSDSEHGERLLGRAVDNADRDLRNAQRNAEAEDTSCRGRRCGRSNPYYR